MQHVGELKCNRPKQVIERESTCELSAEKIEAFHRRSARFGNKALCSNASGQIAGNKRNDPEYRNRHHVARVRNRERVERRKEKEIVGERTGDAGNKTRSQTIGDRAHE